MVGQGSVNHNSRKFNAKNTDPERSHLNITYCQENIKAVFREMFDEALKRYNDKQTRADRKIEDYYEKIRSGKQEKPFHEIILQVGNKEDMSAASEDGQLAAAVLGEYMKDFQERNPQLRVFSAHLHMDEATPHLHIDFVPFTTGSKRGLDTRVSLKQALAAQGFQGGTRGDTEWSQWVRSEKEQLAAVMERHGIEWEDKGTHDQHLSVLDYKKEQRAKEIAVLETVKAEKESQVEGQERRLKELAPAVKNMERLAAEAGVSRSMLGQIERGEANPSVGLLGKLAGALKVPAEVLLENDDFEPLLLLRELDNKAARLDGGKALLRPSLPYDDVLRQETFFLDLYISGRYAPEPMVPGCVCLATSLSGTVLLHAEGQDFQLLERDALRFAADQPFWLENQFNGTARLLLTYRYLK